MTKLNVMFMGTPDFSVGCLDMLVNREDINVCSVVTMPDRQKGRGNKILPTPVKEYALSKGLEVVQPGSVKTQEFYDYLKEKNPDFIAVIAYGKILPKEVLFYPKYGCVNVHASLLPKYRGAAPIQRSIINGEKETGVTTMLMDEGLDTGDMLLVKKVQIDEFETSGTLFDKLADIGAAALSETIDGLLEGSIERKPQNHSEMTYAAMITKDMSDIDWNKDATEICCLIRGLNPSPGAKTYFNGKILKIHMAKPILGYNNNPGTVIIEKDRFIVSCGGDTAAELITVQPEGKNRMSASDYLKGSSIKNDDVLGK